jgi:predicted nucleic acid-binding protein
MPTVISDASVLIGLGAAGRIELLREFYGEVLVPPAVWAEVTSAGTRPGAEEARSARQAGWLQLRAPASAPLVRQLQRTLDAGEAEAIALATELPQSLLLLDDADGRETARQLGLDFTGTVGVLLRAKRVGKLPALKPVLDHLVQQHRFRLSRKLYEAVLRQSGEAL